MEHEKRYRQEPGMALTGSIVASWNIHDPRPRNFAPASPDLGVPSEVQAGRRRARAGAFRLDDGIAVQAGAGDCVGGPLSPGNVHFQLRVLKKSVEIVCSS